MAFFATNIYPADGTTVEWTFSFAGVSPDVRDGTTPYLYPEDVKVVEMYTLNGAKVQVPRVASLSAPNRVLIDGAPIAAGRQVKIYRQTENRYPLVNYRDGQSVSEADLDLANRQAIFLAQETLDAAQTGVLLDGDGNFDMLDRQVVNVADGSRPTDAVNLRQFQRALRVPASEPVLAPLPSAVERANRLLGFTTDGSPALIPAGTDSVAQLVFDLANPAKGASMIAMPGGGSVASLTQSGGASVLGAFSDTGTAVTVQAALNSHRDRLAATPRTFESFGMVGDWVLGATTYTDNTAAFRAMVTSGVSLVRASPGKGYFIGTAKQDIGETGLFDIRTGKALTIDINGGTLAFNNETPAKAGGSGALIYSLDTPVSIGNGTVRCLTPSVWGATDNRGIQMYAPAAWSVSTWGHVFWNLDVIECQSVVTPHSRGSNASPSTIRTQGYHFQSVRAIRCYYGINCSTNGDNFTGTLNCYGHRRAYFVNGCWDHDMTINAYNHAGSTGECVITTYDLQSKTTRDISIRFNSYGGSAPINIGFTTSNSTDHTLLTMKNIKVDANLINFNGTYAVRIMHQLSGPGTNITPSNANFDDISIRLNPDWSITNVDQAIHVDSVFNSRPRITVNAGLDMPLTYTQGAVFITGDTVRMSNINNSDTVIIPRKVLYGRESRGGYVIVKVMASIMGVTPEGEEFQQVWQRYVSVLLGTDNVMYIRGDTSTVAMLAGITDPEGRIQCISSVVPTGLMFTISGHNSAHPIKSIAATMEVITKQ